MGGRRARCTLLLSALLLAACPKRPLSFGPRGQLTDPAPLVAALTARSAKLLRLRSEVSLAAKSPRGSGSTSGLIAAVRPAALRLEVDDFFGNPAAVLTTDGTALGLYQAQSNVYATGAATGKNLATLVPLDLEPVEAVSLLFGDPKPLSDSPRDLRVDRERRSYVLTFEGAGRSQRLDFDTESWLPVDVEVTGQRPYVARFSDFEGTSGLGFPQRVEIESPGGRVALGYRRLEVNPVLPADLFVPVAPPGVQPMEFAE